MRFGKTIQNGILSLFLGVGASVFLSEKNTISGRAISLLGTEFLDWKSFLGNFFLVFISAFIIFEIFSFSKDALQKNLSEMEEERPSSERSKESKDILGKVTDKYHFITRKVKPIERKEKDFSRESNYEGFPELYNSENGRFRHLEKPVKEILLRTIPYHQNSESREKAIEFELNNFINFSEKFPKEDLEKILERGKGKSLRELKSFAREILGRNIYSKGKIESPSQLIAVHKTDYLPENRRIRTHGNSTYTRHDLKEGKPPITRDARQTVSFSLNHPVKANISANWDNKKYAILLPVEKIIDNEIVNLSATDSYSFGDVPLFGKGAEIIISRETYKNMSSKEKERLKRRTGVEIITPQGEKDNTLDETITRRIYERGYDVLSPGFYDEFYNTWDKDFRENISHIAKSYGKNSTMHAWTPSGKIEERLSLIEKEGWSPLGAYGRVDQTNYIQENLKEYEKEVYNARKGEYTKKDISTFEKLRRTINRIGKNK